MPRRGWRNAGLVELALIMATVASNARADDERPTADEPAAVATDASEPSPSAPAAPLEPIPMPSPAEDSPPAQSPRPSRRAQPEERPARQDGPRYRPADSSAHAPTMVPDLRNLQQQLGGPVINQFPALGPQTQPATGAEWAGRWSANPPQPGAIEALRDAAAQLDETANRLESLELYRPADALREQSQRMRLEARAMKRPAARSETGSSAAPVWQNQPTMVPSQPSAPRRFGWDGVSPLPTYEPTSTPAAPWPEREANGRADSDEDRG